MNKPDLNSPSRRRFVQQAGLLVGGASFLPELGMFPTFNAPKISLKFHLFSKHVQFLGYEEMSERIAEAGYDGVDLTVRKGGHVEPERVEQDLPRAVKAIRQSGLDSIVMATNVNDASSTLNQRVLQVAADQGISHYRMEYYSYLPDKSIPESIAHARKKMEELGELNHKLGIIGCYQNHAGTRMGSSPWELYSMLEDTDEKGIGVQYDIRHAMVDGGLNWTKGLELVKPRIHSFVIKDFKWSEKEGKWSPENVPFDEGMVDWAAYFKIMKSYHLDVPVSVHMEYSLGGAEHGRKEIAVDPRVVYDAMKRDLDLARRKWEEA